MEAKYNAFEILTIAEKVERNGAVFYHKAAELFDDAELRKLFVRLADWELKHEEVFAKMKVELGQEAYESEVFELDNYMSANPQVMAGLAVFAVKPDPAEELTGQENKEEILKNALQKEKDTIVFYRGLKSFCRDKAAKKKVGGIIEQEERHIGILKQSLEQL